MKTFTINFKNIGNQSSLRLDFGYRYFFDYKKGLIFDEYKNNTIKLKYVLNLLQSQKVKKGELEQSEKLIDLGNIERRFNNLIDVEEVEEIGSDKNILQDGDLIIPKMQPQMGNIFLNLNHERFIGSTELLEYEVNDNFRPTFLYYLITSKKFLNDLAKLESGKTHRRVNPDDLLKIQIPLIPKQTQDQIVAQIEPIEKEIKNLKSQIKDPKEIINKVFAREFGFDLEKFEQSKKEKFFEVEFRDIANNEDLKFNVVSLSFLNKFIIPNVKYVSLKNIAKNIFAGGDKPKDFSIERNEIYKYPIFSNGKKGNDLQGYSKIAKVYEKSVTISARGSIGYAILRKEPYFPIVRLISIIFDENKILGEYLENVINFLNLEKTGNTIAQLTAPMASKIKIPLPSLKVQQKIVDEIQAELDEQEKIKKKIKNLRNKIDEIIEAVIS